MITTGIMGGAGYTAGELLRLLLWHPQVEIDFVHSESQAGKPVSDQHPDLLGETGLHFTSDINNDVDLWFLCKGHGFSKTFLEKLVVPDKLKIIDLSHDFRLNRANHAFTYGLPELNRTAVKNTRYVANPGCFATAIQLALLPLAKENLLNYDINVHAITGSTGAGQHPAETTHFSWRNNNVSAYKIFTHQHLGEISESIQQLQPSFRKSIHFIPIRGGFTRGIFASLFTRIDKDISWLNGCYDAYYKNHPFVWLSAKNPNLKQIVNTNKCILYLEKHNNQLVVISMLDNLVKGASGQAVQNMNLMFGLPETTGLRLKAVAF